VGLLVVAVRRELLRDGVPVVLGGERGPGTQLRVTMKVIMHPSRPQAACSPGLHPMTVPLLSSLSC
jgi:hypothetical protein